MSKMRVVQVTHPNGPLKLVEREIPEPAREQVRIKVEACGICHSDAVVKEGHWPRCEPIWKEASARRIRSSTKWPRHSLKAKICARVWLVCLNTGHARFATRSSLAGASNHLFARMTNLQEPHRRCCTFPPSPLVIMIGTGQELPLSSAIALATSVSIIVR